VKLVVDFSVVLIRVFSVEKEVAVASAGLVYFIFIVTIEMFNNVVVFV
jgi:hypothetical protein